MKVLALFFQGFLSDAVAAHRIKQGELQLFVIGAQVDQKVVYFVQHFMRSGVFPVDFVNDHKDLELCIQGLFQHKTGLGQRAFRGVNQKDGAVSHAEGPFHFSAEIRVPGCINDIDADALPFNRTVFGCDGDAAFLFQIHGVHKPFFHLLARSKEAALAKQTVHQSGFSVIDMSDDGNVSKVFVF